MLQNKLGIANPVQLAAEEERVTKIAALALYRNGTLDALAPGTFSTLAAIHAALFGDLYEFAGKIRNANGRATRIWLDHTLRSELAKTVDWSLIDREDYLLAMERSPVRDTEIKALVRGALSDSLDDATLLARGIDASYAYEGYAAYRAEDL